MNLLTVFGIVIVLFWIYVFWARDFMVTRWPDKFWRWHAIEDALFAKSRTILGARLYWLGGAMVALQSLASSAGVDITPFINQLANFIPEQYRGLAIGVWMIGTGLLFEWLRRVTTTPVGTKE